MYLHERRYLQPQPRVWQEMQAQATVTPPPHPTSVLFSYASSGYQRRSWARWCNGQYPGHFRGLGRQDRGSRPGSSSPLHTHRGTGRAAQRAYLGSCPPPHHWGADGPGPQPQQNSHNSTPLGESLQSTHHGLRSNADFCPRYKQVAQLGSRNSSATLWDLMSPFIKQGC